MAVLSQSTEPNSAHGERTQDSLTILPNLLLCKWSICTRIGNFQCTRRPEKTKLIWKHKTDKKRSFSLRCEYILDVMWTLENIQNRYHSIYSLFYWYYTTDGFIKQDTSAPMKSEEYKNIACHMVCSVACSVVRHIFLS